MLPMASVKFLAAHDPDKSMPSGFGSAWASIRPLAATTTTMAALILGHTVFASITSPPGRTRRRLPRGCVGLFLELRRDDVGRLEIHRVIDDRGPHDERSEERRVGKEWRSRWSP